MIKHFTIVFQHHFSAKTLRIFFGTLQINAQIITAAILVGSALIVLSKTPPLIFNIPVIGVVGFITSVILGIWIIVSILRKNKL